MTAVLVAVPALLLVGYVVAKTLGVRTVDAAFHGVVFWGFWGFWLLLVVRLIMAAVARRTPRESTVDAGIRDVDEITAIYLGTTPGTPVERDPRSTSVRPADEDGG